LSFENIESFIEKFPVYQYAFIKPDDVEYSEKVRQLCKRACTHYGTSWSCPPAIGKLEKCEEKCLRYTDILVFSTVTELQGGTAQEMETAQKEHEKLTNIICSHMLKEGYITYVLSSSWCKTCQKCTFPKDFCRHPEEMYPCIESHGIMIADLMEKCGMDHYLGGKLYLLFSLVYFKEADTSE
jgi:predicted metal-binding protein